MKMTDMGLSTERQEKRTARSSVEDRTAQYRKEELQEGNTGRFGRDSYICKVC